MKWAIFSFFVIFVMQFKIYLPAILDIPDAALPDLVRRAAEALGERADTVLATRGLLVRQAVLDGRIEGLADQVRKDGIVDLFCDPVGEMPFETQNGALSVRALAESIEALCGSMPPIPEPEKPSDDKL